MAMQTLAIYLNSVELNYYLFTISLDNCNWSYIPVDALSTTYVFQVKKT